MSLRGRLTGLAVIVALLFTAAIVVLVGSRTPGCTVVAPRPSLPAALRALGDFDQSYDATNVAAMEDAAGRAAASLHGDLIGATPLAPVAVAAGRAGSPDAVVVPLRSRASSSPGESPVAGLVVFLRDCQGSAYFGTVEDDVSVQPRLAAFPPVSRDQAAGQLGTSGLRLEYTTSPAWPRWVSLGSASRSVPAR